MWVESQVIVIWSQLLQRSAFNEKTQQGERVDWQEQINRKHPDAL